MRTRRTRMTAVAAVAAISGAIAGGTAMSSVSATTSPARSYTASPAGPGCDAVPSEGEGSFAGMADDPAATAASNSPDLATLSAAIQAAGLAEALEGAGPFTVFAPTNEAFDKIPTNVLDSIFADGELLDSILTYHVVSGEALDADGLLAAGMVTTTHGAALEVSQQDGTLTINGGESVVVCGPIPVANGFVYFIDSVLQPPTDDLGVGATTIIDGSVVVIPGVDTSAPDPTVVPQPGDEPQGPLCASLPPEGEGSIEAMAEEPAGTAIANNPELSTFAEMIAAAGLAETLDGEGPFTIFAPSNEAFEAISQADLDAILADEVQLATILSFHIVLDETLTAADLATAGTAETEHGAELTFAVEADGTLSIDGGAAGVACSNLTVTNGIIHIIDEVLVPPAA